MSAWYEKPIPSKQVATDVFRCLGILTLLGVAGLILLALRLSGHMLPPLNKTGVIRLSIIGSVGTATGVGLLYLRKWAALYFSIATAVYGSWLIVGSVLSVPLPWMLINLALGAGFFVPVVATVK